MPWQQTLGGQVHRFDDLKTLLARATPLRSGDQLAGLAAADAQERCVPIYEEVEGWQQ